MNQADVKTSPFCYIDPHRILAEDELTVVCRDGFPVSLGHTVVILRRTLPLCSKPPKPSRPHCSGVDTGLRYSRWVSPIDGYNIGINHGQAGD